MKEAKEVKELKFYLKRKILNSLSSHNGMPWDYPLFIMFTGVDLDRIQRNYLESQLNGMSPNMRKICATNKCLDGYTYNELLEEMKTVEEVPEDIFNLCSEIPHWNPVEKLDANLSAYIMMIKEAKIQAQKNIDNNPELQEMIETFTKGLDSSDHLPKAEYERRDRV